MPKIAGVGNKVSVIWNGLDDYDVLSVFYRRSTDSGSTFGEAVNLTATAGVTQAIQPGQETLAAKGGYVYSLFLATASNVYFRRSLDSGVNFQGLQELNAAANTPYIAGGWWPVMQDRPHRRQRGHGTRPLGLAHLLLFPERRRHLYQAGAGDPVFFLWRHPDQRRQSALTWLSDRTARCTWWWKPATIRSSFGGYGDFDIFYRGFSPAPAPSGVNNGLHLFSNHNDARWDNMQVPASSYLNFTTQMTGEVWVRPYPGGDYTGWAGAVIKPIFFKMEQGYNQAYSLQTWANSGAAPGPGGDPND